MESQMDFVVSIPRNEAKYPERIAACAPRGMREKIRRAAETQGISAPELVRRAVTRSVSEILLQQSKGHCS
jgi:hypothetical protein